MSICTIVVQVLCNIYQITLETVVDLLPTVVVITELKYSNRWEILNQRRFLLSGPRCLVGWSVAILHT